MSQPIRELPTDEKGMSYLCTSAGMMRLSHDHENVICLDNINTSGTHPCRIHINRVQYHDIEYTGAYSIDTDSNTITFDIKDRDIDWHLEPYVWEYIDSDRQSKHDADRWAEIQALRKIENGWNWEKEGIVRNKYAARLRSEKIPEFQRKQFSVRYEIEKVNIMDYDKDVRRYLHNEHDCEYIIKMSEIIYPEDPEIIHENGEMKFDTRFVSETNPYMLTSEKAKTFYVRCFDRQEGYYG